MLCTAQRTFQNKNVPINYDVFRQAHYTMINVLLIKLYLQMIVLLDTGIHGLRRLPISKYTM